MTSGLWLRPLSLLRPDEAPVSTDVNLYWSSHAAIETTLYCTIGSCS